MNVNFADIRLPDHKKRVITIIPLEVHYSRRAKSNGFCRDTWFKALKRIKNDPFCYVVFVGDMLDADRPSLRARKAVIYAEPERRCALSEDDLDHQRGLREGIIRDLASIKHKILAMVDGDHFRLYENGTTSTWYIANTLKIPKTYLGERMGWVRVNFKSGHGSSRSFDIFVRHGRASASNFGTDVNALVRQSQGFDADLHLAGHTHRSWFVKVPHLYCGRYDIHQRMVAYARAGSLLRGFLYGQTTYPEIAEYSPLSIGWPEIQIYLGRTPRKNLEGTPENPNRRCTQTRYLDVQDIKGLT